MTKSPRGKHSAGTTFTINYACLLFTIDHRSGKKRIKFKLPTVPSHIKRTLERYPDGPQVLKVSGLNLYVVYTSACVLTRARRWKVIVVGLLPCNLRNSMMLQLHWVWC